MNRPNLVSLKRHTFLFFTNALIQCSRDSDCMYFSDCMRLSGGDDSNIGCGAGVRPNSCWTWTPRPNVVN